jgi:hypothetical protein
MIRIEQGDWTHDEPCGCCVVFRAEADYHTSCMTCCANHRAREQTAIRDAIHVRACAAFRRAHPEIE